MAKMIEIVATVYDPPGATEVETGRMLDAAEERTDALGELIRTRLEALYPGCRVEVDY